MLVFKYNYLDSRLRGNDEGGVMGELFKRVKLWFVSHELNDYRPHAFRQKWLSFYSLTLILSHYLAFGVAITGSLIQSPENFSKDLVKITNSARIIEGLNPLEEDPSLTQAAKDKLRDMIDNNYWDHISPNGTEAWYFIDKEGYTYTLAGENLAKGFSDPKKTVTAWLNSPTHKENLLKKDYTSIGIATANAVVEGQNTSMTVQLFGTKGDTSVTPRVLTLGEQVLKSEVNLKNAFVAKNIPYLSLWFIIFIFMILDARMLKKLGLHKIKLHRYQFRLLLVLNISLFILLLAGFSYIA